MRSSNVNISLLSLVLIALAGQGVTKEDAHVEPTAEAEVLEKFTFVAPIEAPALLRKDGWRSEFDLRYWSSTTFYHDISRVVIDLSEAHGAEQVDVLLNGAEIYLAHMLLDEAASMLEGVAPKTPEQERRYLALRHGTVLLSGQVVEGFEVSPLLAADRPDRGFWTSLQAIASGDVASLNANIEASFIGLGLQSRSVLVQMLPVFTEAAIELGYQEYAQAALRLFMELPDLKHSSTGHFLRGRFEEKRGNDSSALEAYFEAAKGWDQYAARGRLAIADMSLRNGSRGALLAAQNTLTEGAEAWRGDRYELELLKRMVRVYGALENDIEGLLALGRILSRFPVTPEAVTARQEATELLAEVYRKGAAGQYPLSAWMDAHLKLMPDFQGFPTFPAHVEAFADYVLGLGATDLASSEYKRAVDLIERHEKPLSAADKTDLMRLTLKLADTQRRAGLGVEARRTLEARGEPASGPDREAYNALLARILADLNDGAALLQTSVLTPSADFLRKQGHALTDDAKWARATGTFLRLWDSHPQEFSLEDATHLLIAANRSDDVATVDRVARAFPGLTKSKALIELAESLNTEIPALQPLRVDMAADRLRLLEEAFESIKNTTSSP